MTRPAPNRLQPLRALRAVRNLLRDPQRTDEVFEIMDALRGRTNQRTLARLRREAPELLERQPELLDLLRDRAALEQLPDGSLGRAYLAFIDREGITPDGLVEASSGVERDQADAALAWVERRGRDSHDLWHLVTGYGTQPVGELCVVAFSAVQTRHLGFATIALFGLLDMGRHVGWRQVGAAVWEAITHARAAQWLPAQDWDALLALPVHDVRARLGIGTPRAYELLRDDLALRVAAQPA